MLQPAGLFTAQGSLCFSPCLAVRRRPQAVRHLAAAICGAGSPARFFFIQRTLTQRQELLRTSPHLKKLKCKTSLLPFWGKVASGSSAWSTGELFRAITQGGREWTVRRAWLGLHLPVGWRLAKLFKLAEPQSDHP